MLEVEKNMRLAIIELFHVVRMNSFMKKADAELNELLDNSDYALKIFEHASGSDKLSDAKAYFDMLADKIKNSYGAEAISNAFGCFNAAFADKDFYESLGVKAEINADEKSAVFKAMFDRIVLVAEKWDSELDCYSYFIESVKEKLMPTGEKNTDIEEICPYCDGVPQRILKTDFFGPHSGEGDGYVWGCECGAYALIDDEGRVIGKLGDAMLHQKRSLLKRAICELCNIAGLTCFESYRWFSLITDTHLEAMNDVEYLSLEQCNLALRLFVKAKNAASSKAVSIPKDRNELFMFFLDGGRLSVCNAYGFQYGKILIPTEVGTDGIKVYGKNGSQSISFSKDLKFEFRDDNMFVIHPSGKKEKFRMIPAEIRNMLFSLNSNEVKTAKAV